MSYNWTSAATPQGRERLKELMDGGFEVAVRYWMQLSYPHHNDPAHYHKFAKLKGSTGYSCLPTINHSPKWEDVVFDDLEFLDPSPSPEPVADENGLLPCAHCGNRLAIVKSFNGLTVRCYTPKCVFNPQVNMFFESENEAIKAANTRSGKESKPSDDKEARIKELELVIEYAADCLDAVDPDDSDFEGKINAIYKNLENKTRYEI